MTRSRKIIVLISSVCFLAGFLVAYGKEELIKKDEGQSETTTKSNRLFFGRNQAAPEKEVSRITGSIKYDYASFAAKLKGSLSSEEYEALFEEVLLIKDMSLFDKKMSLVLYKWSETSPRQVIEKIREHKGAEYWVNVVFDSWARRNPEEAAAYYEESEDKKVKGNVYALSAVACQWALHDLDRAWEWLHGQKDQVFTENFEQIRDMLVYTVVEAQSERIPKLLEKLDVKTQEENAYIIANNWPTSQGGLEEWINELPEKGKYKAEAGRIVATSQRDFQMIKEEVSKLDRDMQAQVALELVSPVFLYGGRDMVERVEWYMETLPEDLIEKHLKYTITFWFEEDNERARQWIESLPENKKSKFINLINDFSVIKYS